MSWTPEQPNDTNDGNIANATFFPDVDPLRFVKDFSIPARHDESTVRHLLAVKMLEVNDNLADYAAEQIAAGNETLADVPAVKLDNESNLVRLYFHAVFCYAKAALIQESRDMIPRNGDANDDEFENDMTNYAAEGQRAITRLLGEPTWSVGLI